MEPSVIGFTLANGASVVMIVEDCPVEGAIRGVPAIVQAMRNGDTTIEVSLVPLFFHAKDNRGDLFEAQLLGTFEPTAMLDKAYRDFLDKARAKAAGITLVNDNLVTGVPFGGK